MELIKLGKPKKALKVAKKRVINLYIYIYT